MDKRRVLLISPPNLLRDSLEHILSKLEDVQVTGCLPLDSEALEQSARQPHDLILIAEDETCAQQAARIMSSLLEAHPNTPIIRIKLEPNVLLLYSAEALPARVSDLIRAIRQAPVTKGC
jgi:DNA-binding NarL/FixJ family response regulator